MTERLRGDVVRLYESGLTSREVAKETGVGKTTVLTILKQEGVEMRPRGVHYS
ncbi:helix-turn-helix domain-containing protein [Gordonia westfalica]|uniref:helix-turn-helix domain-containing protein n=1 Tax=Gordonia westfalica TaxID=158898 RepID=UPI003CC7A0B0